MGNHKQRPCRVWKVQDSCPLKPTLKERERAQADTLTINQALQHALWNRRKNSLACGLAQNRALTKNDHDRSEASHASLTASGSEPTAGGRDYQLQSFSSPHCPTCICGAAISCIRGAGPTPVTMGGRFASAALVRPPFSWGGRFTSAQPPITGGPGGST